MNQLQAAGIAAIAGLWTFSGGQVAVHELPDGTAEGVVVRGTTFDACSHPVGERMWTGMAEQPDGSVHGRHQWYLGAAKTADCRPGAQGPTAWRVVTDPAGRRALKVCFSDGGGPQPTIAPDGTEAETGWGCAQSDWIGPVPVKPLAPGEVFTLPAGGSRSQSGSGTQTGSAQSQSQSPKKAARTCRSRRHFRIRLRHPKGDALKTVTVFVNGKRVAVRRGARVTAPIDLRNLPKGRYTVRIRATTVLGRRASETRRYRTCTKKSQSKKAKKKA